MKYNILIIIILCLISFSCQKSSFHTHDVTFDDYRMGASYTDDVETESVLAPFRKTMKAKMDEVLIISEGELRKGRPESTMGNFAADATEIMAERLTEKPCDFAIHNYSGIRIGNVGKGPITLGRIYEMMPFDNYLVTIEMSASEVQEICDFMAGNGGWPSSASLTYAIEDSKAVNVKIDGKALESNTVYTMASNNYVIESAGYLDFLALKEVKNTNVYVRDALADYLRTVQATGQTLNVQLDKRVTNK